MHQYRLGTSWRGSSPVEKDAEMDARLNMSQQCTLTVKQAHCAVLGER